MAKGPAQLQLERLDEVFGPGYFEHGRLVFTICRDKAGVMKVAHRLQHKVNEILGAMVEVVMEHVKHELWLKLHEASSDCSLHKGMEVPECQVTDIPDGIREHPYRREHLPTLEVLLLWYDPDSRTTRGRCLYTMAHPELPSLEQVDGIFAQIEPYFAKRWLVVQLRLAPPVRGEFEEADTTEDALASADSHVGAGVQVTLLACHPLGFASDAAAEDGVTHVSQCQPLSFKALTDHAGQAKICFLPAALNRVQVEETDRFHGNEVSLLASDIKTLDQGVTNIEVRLLPKALATIVVHVFEMPRKLPPTTDEADGIIDWAAEERQALPAASVQISALKDNPMVQLQHSEGDSFVVGGLAEGCVDIVVSCPGYTTEERTIMLLVGPNEFYIPLSSL
eukprot:TRINITY_DN109903_c0_g1_i1.p1 TRINITY_DN109903_c0_g1~~TRINITY_DN109903_c0_g1_i1.p1  ORF type:complete len:394 (-),score=85.70 TRINITY_DN109903_c0_g1_i1:96-1277(-)